MSTASDHRLQWSYRLAIVVLVAAIVAYAVLMFLFAQRPMDYDDLGLFNPVYMQLHYGHMSYPVHGPGPNFQSMFIHPPIRYLEIATLMRLGLALPYAEGFSIFGLMILIAVVIAASRFDGISKLSLLFGLLAGVIWVAKEFPAEGWIHFVNSTFGVRPDAEVGLMWFLGLVLLQDGTLRRWYLPELFLGSLALTYASELHYYAVVGVLGVVYFLVRAWRELQPSAFWKVLIAIAAGCALPGIPYLFSFVIPDLTNILAISRGVQAGGTWLSPIQRHFEMYATWVNFRGTPGIGGLYALLYPFINYRVPLFAIGSAALLLRKDTRGISIASLPVTAFVFFYSKGKWEVYYLPELIIYFSGLLVFAGTFISAAANKLAPKVAAPVAALCLLAIASWATLLGYPEDAALQLSSKPRVSPMDVARASAKEIVGYNALVGDRSVLWYVSGAEKWHDVGPDLLWPKDISNINLRDYLSQFDAIAEHTAMSNATYNVQLQSMPSWYKMGILKLRGFFLTDLDEAMNFFLFRTTPSKVKGFLFERGVLSQFVETPAGGWVFASDLCRVDPNYPSDPAGLPHFLVMLLPKASSQQQLGVATWLAPYREFASKERKLRRTCAPLDTRRGKLTIVNLDTFLSNWHVKEHTIKFFQNINDAVVPNLKTQRVDLPKFDTNHFVLAQGSEASEGPEPKTIWTLSQPYSYAATIDIPDVKFTQRAWVQIRHRVVRGEVGFGVLDTRANQFLSRIFVEKESEFETTYLPLLPSSGPTKLIVQNGTPGSGVSNVIIQSIAIVRLSATTR